MTPFTCFFDSSECSAAIFSIVSDFDNGLPIVPPIQNWLTREYGNSIDKNQRRSRVHSFVAIGSACGQGSPRSKSVGTCCILRLDSVRSGTRHLLTIDSHGRRMSRYKDYREPKRRGFDDDYAPHDRAADRWRGNPRSSPPQASQPVEAIVKWFKA